MLGDESWEIWQFSGRTRIYNVRDVKSALKARQAGRKVAAENGGRLARNVLNISLTMGPSHGLGRGDSVAFRWRFRKIHLC